MIQGSEVDHDPTQGSEIFGGMSDVGLVVVLEREGRFVEAADVATDLAAAESGRLGFHMDQATEIAHFPRIPASIRQRRWLAVTPRVTMRPLDVSIRWS